MGKPPVTQSKEKPPTSKTNNTGGSPIIFIIAIVSVIVIGLFLFRDKIFKKNENKKLSDIKQKESTQEKPQEPEILEGEQAQDINEKFVELNN